MALSQAKIQLKRITNFLQDSAVNVIVGDFNLDYEKRRENSYQHRKVCNKLLEALTAFDFIQIVKKLTTMFKHRSLIMSLWMT
jgi:hypothetical protein